LVVGPLTKNEKKYKDEKRGKKEEKEIHIYTQHKRVNRRGEEKKVC